MRKAMVIAAAIPVLGLAALVARAEVKVRLGVEWLIGIEGYDPRDLLSGRFLRYRYSFQWEGADTCGEEARRTYGSDSDNGEDDSGPRATWSLRRAPVSSSAEALSCCVCLTRRGDGLKEPAARLVHCEEADACEGSLKVADVAGPQKYFVPEDRALELETSLRGREAALVIAIGKGSAPAVKELYLDGKPWREALPAGSSAP